jgi:CubicO group peptidase (beta-lactamase class C family)
MATEDPLHRLLAEGADDGTYTAAVAVVGDVGGDRSTVSLGVADPRRDIAASPETVFDCASLTKPVVTTTVVLGLVEEGRISLTDTVSTHVPELEGRGHGAVCLHQLLAHTSGLRPYYFDPDWSDIDHARDAMLDADISTQLPGEAHEYSCLNFVYLALVAERVTGEPLPKLARRYVFEPVGMSNSTLGPPGEDVETAVTRDHEYGRGELRGDVHDPLANVMNSRSGNAGLFATAGDIAAFARALLDPTDAVPLAPSTVRAMALDHTPDGVTSHGLGWRLGSAYEPATTWSNDSIGHTGFTGTSLWLDRTDGRFAVLLTNEVYTGKEDSGMTRLRERVHGVVGAGRWS